MGGPGGALILSLFHAALAIASPEQFPPPSAPHLANGESLGSAGSVGANPAMRFNIAMFDGVKLPDATIREVAREVEKIFELLGAEVGWVDRENNPRQPKRGLELKVVLVVNRPATWGLRERVMGTVLGHRFPNKTVYVFYPSVLRTIRFFDGMPFPQSGISRFGTESPKVARALARVIAHELIHVLTPGRPHSKRGLMAQRLDWHDLLDDRVVLDSGFTAAFRLGLLAAIEDRSIPVPVADRPEGSSQEPGAGQT